jgi:hypothetical protein
MAGHGFDPLSPGDSTPASFLDARAPSVSFAQIVSVCTVLSATPCQDLEVPPAIGTSPVPESGLAKDAISRPPADPPPPTPRTLLPSNNFPPLVPPSGSLMKLLIHDGPLQPSPFNILEDGKGMRMLLPNSLWGPPSFFSVNRVVTCPRVLGFRGDGRSYGHINLTGMTTSESPGSLINGGANICLTGDLDLLFDVVEIPPLPISVALQGEITKDDCCTARSKIPLQLDDGLIYWQDSYYSKNMVEIIISPQAIVDSSDVFRSWHQTGYRNGDSTPGCIRFHSYDGLLSMTMTLVHHKGLHY